MSSTKATKAAANFLVRQKYRSLGRLVNRLPEPRGPSSLCPEQSWEELRAAFREPLAVGGDDNDNNDEESALDHRLELADKKLSFLKMVTPKPPKDSNSGRWVYKKNGERLEGNSQKRDAKGRVISNWDGSNLDPDSVKQHNYQLKRMGFRNNAHAKGFF